MASNTKLSNQGTKFIKFRGNIQTFTSGNEPTDVNDGEIAYKTDTNTLLINEGGVWFGIALTTTTSTSTTTTTTSTSTS